MPKRKPEPPKYPINDSEDVDRAIASTRFVDSDVPPSEKKKTLNSNIEKLSQALEGVDQGQFERSVKDELERRLNAAMKELSDRLPGIEIEIDKETKRAAAHAKPPDPEIQGKARMAFVNTGMGDCTIITTPGGKKIMIDCGSTAMDDVPGGDEIIRNTINSSRFLNGTSYIDLLLLTHPDQDHYNKLETILSPLSVRFGLVYYGGTRPNPHKENDFAKYSRTGGSQYIYEAAGVASGTIRSVIFRQEGDKEKSITRQIMRDPVVATAGEEGAFGKEFIDEDTKAIVLYYEENFRISILAANVSGFWTKMKGKDVFLSATQKAKTGNELTRSSTPENVGSLLIMIQAFNHHCLICGDATAITERFVVKKFPNTLKKIQTIRIGHHGSATSSAKSFVDAMPNVDEAIASTGGKATVLHGLPQEGILQLFLDMGKLETGKKAHTIYGYQTEGQGNAAVCFGGPITKSLWATGSNGTRAFTIENTSSATSDLQ